MKPRQPVATVARHALRLLLAGLFILPLVWLLASSLRQPGLPPPRAIEWLPDPIAWGNYARIFDLAPLDRYALNSLAVVVLAVPLTLLTASWAGFALAQLSTDERTALLRLSVILLMVPFTAVWLGRFLIFKQLGLIDTIGALVAPAVMGTSPFFVLLYYWSFRRLPAELYEAARLDGASALSIWRTIAFPLAWPTSLAVAVLTFAAYWGDFVSPLLYLKSPAGYTLPIGLQLLQQMDSTNFPLLLAASTVMIAPLLVVFLLLPVLMRRMSRLSAPSADRDYSRLL